MNSPDEARSLFSSAAPFLSHPLVLIGFVVFLFYGVLRTLVAGKILRPLSATVGGKLLTLFVTYGFILALCTIIGGFILQYLSTESSGGSPPHTSTNITNVYPARIVREGGIPYAQWNDGVRARVASDVDDPLDAAPRHFISVGDDVWREADPIGEVGDYVPRPGPRSYSGAELVLLADEPIDPGRADTGEPNEWARLPSAPASSSSAVGRFDITLFTEEFGNHSVGWTISTSSDDSGWSVAGRQYQSDQCSRSGDTFPGLGSDFATFCPLSGRPGSMPRPGARFSLTSAFIDIPTSSLGSHLSCRHWWRSTCGNKPQLTLSIEGSSVRCRNKTLWAAPTCAPNSIGLASAGDWRTTIVSLPEDCSGEAARLVFTAEPTTSTPVPPSTIRLAWAIDAVQLTQAIARPVLRDREVPN